ncbi:hypothetical protein SELMODRAFT_424772 [Selaginella moellendorffii]|uniref:SUI1 domain-containing protein n=1 Tax=Selaginella moellendorffii TaxID=88036 RepID=D8SRL0_SELML|nr:hypothetical protein SELMODRAFT_424772 [Selaginella moellendorffii]
MCQIFSSEGRLKAEKPRREIYAQLKQMLMTKSCLNQDTWWTYDYFCLKKEFNNKRLKDVKRESCCNGTVVDDPELGQVIQLHGDQRKNVSSSCAPSPTTCWSRVISVLVTTSSQEEERRHASLHRQPGEAVQEAYMDEQEEAGDGSGCRS